MYTHNEVSHCALYYTRKPSFLHITRAGDSAATRKLQENYFSQWRRRRGVIDSRVCAKHCEWGSLTARLEAISARKREDAHKIKGKKKWTEKTRNRGCERMKKGHRRMGGGRREKEGERTVRYSRERIDFQICIIIIFELRGRCLISEMESLIRQPE